MTALLKYIIMHLVHLAATIVFLLERGFAPSDPHSLLFESGFAPSDPHILLKPVLETGKNVLGSRVKCDRKSGELFSFLSFSQTE